MVIVLPTGLVGWETDHLFFISQVWWIDHAIGTLHASPFFDPASFYPSGYDLGRGAYVPAATFPAIPLTLAVGPVVSYNALIVLSFLLTALGGYAWVGRLSANPRAGFVAGPVMPMC